MTESSFTPPEVDDLNERMPAFEFVTRLASDDCKAVYMVKQKSLDRRAAIKIYSPAQSASEGFRKDFAATTKVMAKLKHPNLIGVYDSGFEDGMVYLVSEFVAGKPLWNSTKGESVHLKHVQTLVEGICVGMAHAHKNDICHGALSLKNILLDETHMPKIGGFSQASGDASQLDPSALRFRAPEMAEDEAKATPQADVYSIGVILREMAVGQTEGLDALGEIEKIGPSLKRLVEKATSPDPSVRHRSVEDFYEELLDAFDPETAKKPAGAMLKTAAVKLPPGGAKPGMPNSPAGRGPGIGKPGVGPGASPGAKPAPMMPVKTSSPAKIWIHLGIIVVLLIAIRVVWKAYEDKKEANQAAEQAKEINPQHEVKVIRHHRPAGGQRKPINRDPINTDPSDDFPNDPVTPQDTGPTSDEIAKLMARLRFDLARGSRAEMPEGTVEKSGHYFYHVNIPMTWREAFWFAIDHGGHLAIPGSKATAEWMREELASDFNDPFWVGAAKSGRHAWTLVDGRPWRPKDPSVSTGEFVAVGAEGELIGAKGPVDRSFVIQWTRDGSNPGSLDKLLEITKESMSTAAPIYPPGTYAYGIRNYLFVPQATDWKKAVLSARASGGHLMVVGGIAEKFNADKMTKDVAAEDGIWLGGFHLPEKGWRWTTGEAWRSTDWPQSKPAQSVDAALLMLPGGAWEERSRDAKASGYIIEWSPDSKSASR